MSIIESIRTYFTTNKSDETREIYDEADSETNSSLGSKKDSESNFQLKTLEEESESSESSKSYSASDMEEYVSEESDGGETQDMSEVVSDTQTNDKILVEDVKSSLQDDNLDEIDRDSVVFETKEANYEVLKTKREQLAGLSEIKTFGTVNCKISYEVKKTCLNVNLQTCTGTVTKEDGGPGHYQLRLTILPDKKSRWNSKLLSGNPLDINELVVFKNIVSDAVSDAAIRFRLYAVQNGRRNYLLSESILAMSYLNLRGEEVHYKVQLEERSLPKPIKTALNNRKLAKEDQNMVEERDKAFSEEVRQNQAQYLNRLQSLKESKFYRIQDHKELTRAELILKKNAIDWTELQTSMAYNSVSGRLTIHVIRASNIKTGFRKAVDTFVMFVLKKSSGEIICKRTTSVIKKNTNPDYDQTLILDLPSSLVNEITLMIYLCKSNVIFGKNVIGWLSMGLNNSGQEEQDHWDEIIASKGEFITRNHQIHLTK